MWNGMNVSGRWTFAAQSEHTSKMQRTLLPKIGEVKDRATPG
jgi:hypothetical protein